MTGQDFDEPAARLGQLPVQIMCKAVFKKVSGR